MLTPPSSLEPSNKHVLVFDIFDVLFTYQKAPVHPKVLHVYHLLGGSKNFYEPIPAGIEILKTCHRALQGKNLFILSNIGNPALEVMQKAYPDIFSLFDGIVTSGNSGYKKPDRRIYEHLLDTHHLDAQQCIFIDDKQDNILAAQSVGMRGILCDNHTNVVDQLKNYGIWYDTASTPL